MKRTVLFLVLGCCFVGVALAQGGRKKIVVETPYVEPREAGSEKVVFCFRPSMGDPGGSLCSFEKGFFDNLKVDGKIEISVEQICEEIRNEPVVGDWYLSASATPLDPMWRVDCAESRAYEVLSAGALGRLPPPDPVSRPNPPPRDPAPAARPSPLRRELYELEDRLEAIEKRVPKARDLKDLKKGQEELRKEIDELRLEYKKELEELKKSQELSCRRSDGTYGGREEVMVSIGGEVLRFLKIRAPPGPVTVGLSEEKAAELLREVQRDSKDPVVPRILLSVPAVTRQVDAFYFQDRLIDRDLYARLTGGGDARKASYQEASRFIEELNTLCVGRARFALPTEDEFLIAAKKIYNPVENGLKPCVTLTEEGSSAQLTELLGNAWQLTQSLCQPFGDDPGGLCPEGSYVRKGGTPTSSNPLECMPEYRGVAPYAVAQKDTSFRLVLAE